MTDNDETSGLNPSYQRDIVDVLESISGESGDQLGCHEARLAAEEIRTLRELLRQRWVPVAEREPEEGRRVLVQQGGIVFPAKRVVLGLSYVPKYREMVQWEDDYGEWVVPRPVKWMPLPEAQP